MKKTLKFISLILAFIFLLSGTMMIVCYAENEAPAPDAGAGAGDAGAGDAGAGDAGAGAGDAGAGDAGAGDAGAGDAGSGGSGGSGDAGSNDNSGYDSGQSNDYSGYNNEDNNNNNYQVEDSDQLFYGDASNYDYNVSAENNENAAGSVSSNTKLYNSSGMSAADAAPNEWSDITLDEKTVKTGVTNFSSIKSNTETEDNGYLILYIGYALLGLAALGILYFIIATIAHRNAVRKAERLEQRRRNSSTASHSAAARMEERERRESASASYSKRTSRFADEDDYSYASRRGSSRSDTDEVYVPRRVATKKR